MVNYTREKLCLFSIISIAQWLEPCASWWFLLSINTIYLYRAFLDYNVLSDPSCVTCPKQHASGRCHKWGHWVSELSSQVGKLEFEQGDLSTVFIEQVTGSTSVPPTLQGNTWGWVSSMVVSQGKHSLAFVSSGSETESLPVLFSTAAISHMWLLK